MQNPEPLLSGRPNLSGTVVPVERVGVEALANKLAPTLGTIRIIFVIFETLILVALTVYMVVSGKIPPSDYLPLIIFGILIVAFGGNRD